MLQLLFIILKVLGVQSEKQIVNKLIFIKVLDGKRDCTIIY